MKLARYAWLAIAPVLAAGALVAAPGRVQEGFPHDKHANLFPLCTTCHAGAVEPGEPIWPAPAACGSCHDGVVQQPVTWEPRPGPRPGNRRFTHEQHDRAVTAHDLLDSAAIRNCTTCHTQPAAPRMHVENAVVQRCLDCHGLIQPHVDVPARECAKCHVPLTEAPLLTTASIQQFPEPASHDAPDFIFAGHGRLAREPGSMPERPGVAASCATCHTRNLCITCHVNAAESPVISALGLDDRSPVFATVLPVPPSHHAPDFLRTHGRQAERGTATCATCHTRESCMTCHVAPLRAVAVLPASAPDRAPGAQLTRHAPPSHELADFRERHGREANARPATCATCHTRSMCLECHRPDVDRKPRYHTANFLTRHPSAAYSREASCSDCHNPAQFCQSCHQQSGLVAAGRIGGAGYHDVFRGFGLGHGQAARQSLESCAACHAERDCTACHSAVGGGFRFNPHGPGFNAARMQAKNPSLCIACHGRAIPGTG